MNSLSFDRRRFLRAVGTAVALPTLDYFVTRTARAAQSIAPRRLVCICTTLGIHAENLFPERIGRDFALTPYLEPLAALREKFTLFSGHSHPEVDGGHSSEASYLTAAPHPGAASFRNTISLDQLAVEKLPPETRYSSLQLTTGGGSLSVGRSGVTLPADFRPSEVFKRLFLAGSPAEVAEQVRRLREGQSVLDLVADDAQRLQRRAGKVDRARLDDYFTTVREVERRLHAAEAWEKKPKPVVKAKPPQDVVNNADFAARTQLMFDLVNLALETDSTRVVSLRISGTNLVPPIDGVTMDWHNLSHHGKDPEKLEQLRVIELEQMKLFAGFLERLAAVDESGKSLLDSTQVLYGSNLGNASSHDTKNLPIIVAGGGHRHGEYVAGDPQSNTPVGNIYVALLQRLGVEVEKFANNSGIWSPA